MTIARRQRDSFTDRDAARMLGITLTKLYRICAFFDSNSEDEWQLVPGECFDYEPGQARKRRFYEEGVMAIAKYLEETEGQGLLARLHEFFTHHRAKVTRALVRRRIVQVTQNRSAIEIRGELVFLAQPGVVDVLGTNGKGMKGAVRRIQEESAALEGAEGLEIDRDFADFEGKPHRHWSQIGIRRLARIMHEKGRITKARRAWVKAVADVAEDCFVMQRKELESHEARVKAAKTRALKKAGKCVVSGRKPAPGKHEDLQLDVHHLFDAHTRPDLASLDDNLLVVCSSIHKNFHQWMGRRPCEPKDFVDYLLHNELGHFQGSVTTQSREERRQQQLMQKLELLQARFEGNHLLY